MSDLTIAYITSRREPHIEWFWDSLVKQVDASDIIYLIIVDRFAREPVWSGFSLAVPYPLRARRVPPKPNVWSGEHRLTSEDYFSASNARNTAAALCRTSWIAYVDDLSILQSGWLQSVREAMAGNYIALGAYQKVKKLVVDNGLALEYESFPAGFDTRKDNSQGDVTPCAGSWMYGCSVAMPLEVLLKINGWPESLCDGMGSEDYCTGIVLQNAGYIFRYDRRMMTLESEEDHHLEPPMKRSDFGVSPRDKSHAALEIAMQSKHFDNDFGDGMTLRQLRDKVLAGEPFPVRTNPRHEWFTGKLLSEL